MTDNVTKIWGVSLSILAFSLAVSTASAQTCGSQPSCSVLGYTHSDDECAGQETLKCPFDRELVYCSSPQTLTEKTCAVGDTVYSNGKCYQETPSGLTAKGIVFDAQNRKMLVQAIVNAKPAQCWIIENGKNSGLTTCGDIDYCLATGPDGKTATQRAKDAIFSTMTGNQSDYGFWGSTGTIPSIAELKLMNQNIETLNNAAQKAGIIIGLTSYTGSSSYAEGCKFHYWSFSNRSEDQPDQLRGTIPQISTY